MVTLENVDISPVLSRVLAATGIDFSLYRESTLRRRISRRMVACRCDELPAYLDLLDREPAEIGKLLRDLTIKWTEFFRDPQVFRFLETQILPSIIAANAGSPEPISIWSAGCATGEEAYSVAASLYKMSAFRDAGSRAVILGTDVDSAAVESASRGDYTKHMLSKPPEDCPAECFSDDGKCICVGGSLKALAKFAVHDLTAPGAGEALKEIWPGKFDLILCRNVLVYLQRPTQARVLDLCCSLLKPGGFLVLGAREMVPSAMHDRLQPFDIPMRTYRHASEAL